MARFQEAMQEYKRQLQRGYIQEAYQGLMAYIRGLRAHFESSHPSYSLPGGVYYGYMDMTYFAVIPESLGKRDLKVALVFNHGRFCFEAWLSAKNKGVQAEYWQKIKEGGWDRYPLAPSIRGFDHIISSTLAEDPDFSDLESLTARLEKGTLDFIREVEGFLEERPT